MQPRQPLGDRARRPTAPARFEKRAHIAQDEVVIRSGSHRLVEHRDGLVMPSRHPERLAVARHVADVDGEQLIRPANQLELFLGRDRAARERKIVLRRVLPLRQRVALKGLLVECALGRLERRAFEKPDFRKEACDRMAAIRQPDVANLEPWAEQVDMARVAVGRVVEDIGGRDEALPGEAALDLIIQPPRLERPAVLERNDAGIERKLRRERDRGRCAGEPAEPDRGKGAHARSVGGDPVKRLRRAGRRLERAIDVRQQIPVVVAREDVDRVDAARNEERFAEAVAVQCAVVGVGVERHHAIGQRQSRSGL